jgi:thymidylate synthase
MNLVSINAVDIQDAWFQCISAILDKGSRYEVQHGSYVGQTRLEFDFITVCINYPYAEPYDLMLPKIPVQLGIPDPVAPGYVEQYLPYLMTDHINECEQYTYGNRINQKMTDYYRDDDGNFIEEHTTQVEHWVKVLKQTPNTNQAVLQVAQPSDFLIDDPPCLREIGIKIKTWKDGMGIENKKLIFYPSFRSWDLWGGFPANLAGIAVLQKDMADAIGVEAGPIIASSKALHIYGYVEELAKLRTGKHFITG